MVNQSSTRAGKYMPQPNGYSAFIPAKFPPNPPIEVNNAMQSALSHADYALGFLNGAITTLPEPQLFVMMYVRQEALMSSRIEGTQSSLQEILDAEAKLFGNAYQSDAFEVINYIAATQTGLEQIKHAQITTPLIKELHHTLLQNTRGSRLTPGHLRTKQVWIGPPQSPIHEADFVPPPPDQVQLHLQELDRFIVTNQDLPVLVKIGLVHAQFETIHPFTDGNGRIGRLILTLMLCKSEVLQHPVLYLSRFFNRHRSEYYEKLQAVREEGKWEEWLLFFLRGVEEVSKHSARTAQRILAMREQDRDTINKNLRRAAVNGHLLLDRLYTFPAVGVIEVQKLINVSYTTANTLVRRLVDIGLLREYTGYARNKRYILHRYVELFDDI